MEELRKYIGGKEKAYIRTITQFEAVRLLTELDAVGYRWIDGGTIDVDDTGWVQEGENTVYCIDNAFGIISLSDIEVEPNYKEFSELVDDLKDKNMKRVKEVSEYEYGGAKYEEVVSSLTDNDRILKLKDEGYGTQNDTLLIVDQDGFVKYRIEADMIGYDGRIELTIGKEED